PGSWGGGATSQAWRSVLHTRSAHRLIQRLPRAACGRYFGRFDHCGCGHRIGDGGVRFLSTGDSQQELLGLDGLEVVKAHRVPWAWLEPGVFAMLWRADHRRESLLFIVSTEHDFQFIHAFKIPLDRTFRAVDFQSVTALRSHSHPGCIDSSDRAVRHAFRAETHQRCGVVLILDLTLLTAFDQVEMRALAHG